LDDLYHTFDTGLVQIAVDIYGINVVLLKSH